MKKIGIVSDTHCHFDSNLQNFLEPCDIILHAGDIGCIDVIDKLRDITKTYAVYGNIDNYKIRSEIPEYQIIKIENFNILLIHIAGKPGKYNSKTYGLIKDNHINMLVCGHSHILKIQYFENLQLMHINPGAYGNTGFHKFRTALRFDISAQELINLEILELKRS